MHTCSCTVREVPQSHGKGVWRCVWAESGVQCVIVYGTYLTPVSSAEGLDSGRPKELVSVPTTGEELEKYIIHI